MLCRAGTRAVLATVPLMAACGTVTSRRPSPIAAVSPGDNAPGESVAITHVTVIDVAASVAATASHADQTVLISGGRITAVGATTGVAIPRGARVLDGRGQYLVPGLWDAHGHMALAGEAALPVYVVNGVTTVRDLGGEVSTLLAWRREIGAATRVGPRLLVAGPTIEGAWWLDRVLFALANGDSLLRTFPIFQLSPRVRLATPDQAAGIVDSLVRLGVDLVKFRNLRGDEFRALGIATRRRGVPLVGHAPRDVSLGEAAEAGMRSIEHAETVTLRLGDAPRSERWAEVTRVAHAGTAITPTLVTDQASRLTPESVAYSVLADTGNAGDPRRRYLTPGLLNFWRFDLASRRLEVPSTPASRASAYRREVADLRLAHDIGVSLLVGTDVGVPPVYPGFSVHEGLQLLVEEVGLTPLEALRAATLAPARVMRMDDSLGVIAPGQVADLLMLDASPLRDIRNTTHVQAVFLRGRPFVHADLDKLFDGAAQSVQTSERVRDRLHEPSATSLTLADLAADVGHHPSFVARTFRRRFFGLSIGEYVRLAWSRNKEPSLSGLGSRFSFTSC